MFSKDVYYNRKIFWFRCCLRTKYDGIFWEVLISRRFLQNPTDTPPLQKTKKRDKGGVSVANRWDHVTIYNEKQIFLYRFMQKNEKC